jgi:endonuclease YncB( thermonuclease family)
MTVASRARRRGSRADGGIDRLRPRATSAAAAAVVAALICLVAASAAFAQTTLNGRAVDIADGDTITVLDGRGTQHRIRIAGIDAPERGQPGGHRSKESLAALVYEQPVRVEWQRRDRNGILVGKVWVALPDSRCRGQPDCPLTLDAGLAQITIGRAWWSAGDPEEQSEEDRGRYGFAEQEARARKAGLWRDGTAVPPWEWRARRSGGSPPAVASPR